MKLLDTDVCIEILRGNESVIQHREQTLATVATTWITAAELYFGAANSSAPQANRSLVDDFLATLPVLGLDRPATRRFGELKTLLRQRGEGLADADLLIASIALARGAVVITGNRRHYERVPNVELEDWIRPD